MEKIVTTTSFSQANVLQAKMKEEKLSHGETVQANISPVRLDMDHGAVVLYFCPMKTLEVLEIVAKGDGDVIPMQVKVEGLNVPSDYPSGLYEIRNVELTSNGTIQVRATGKTTWEYIETPLPALYKLSGLPPFVHGGQPPASIDGGIP